MEEVSANRIRPLAVIVGTAVDTVGSLITRFLVSSLMAVVILSRGGDEADMDVWFTSLPYLLFSFLVSLGFVALGGFVAGRLAKQSELLNAGVIGAVEAFMSVLFVALVPMWFTLLYVVTVVPSALCGGYLAYRLRRRSSAAPTSTMA